MNQMRERGWVVVSGEHQEGKLTLQGTRIGNILAAAVVELGLAATLRRLLAGTAIESES